MGIPMLLGLSCLPSPLSVLYFCQANLVYRSIVNPTFIGFEEASGYW